MTPEKFLTFKKNDYIVPDPLMKGLEDLANFADEAFQGWSKGDESSVQEAFAFFIGQYISHLVLPNSQTIKEIWNEEKDEQYEKL